SDAAEILSTPEALDALVGWIRREFTACTVRSAAADELRLAVGSPAFDVRLSRRDGLVTTGAERAAPRRPRPHERVERPAPLTSWQRSRAGATRARCARAATWSWSTPANAWASGSPGSASPWPSPPSERALVIRHRGAVVKQLPLRRLRQERLPFE